MPDTDITLPLTPAKIGRAVSAIVEKAIPSPRQENCMAVGQMERELVAYAGRLVQAAYDDAAGIHRDGRERLARHLYLQAHADDPYAQPHWDYGGTAHVNKDTWRAKADAALDAINGKDS